MAKQSKTILFYINSIHDGGAERVIIQLAYRFALAGYKSILVTSFVDSNEYPVPDNVERISIEEKEIKQSKIKRNLSRIVALRQLCKKNAPICVISFMVEPCFRALISTIGLPVKNIVSVRNDPNRDYSGFFGFFIGKIIMPMADGCVFQTQEAREWFPLRFQKKSKVILNAVDHVFFEQTRVVGNNTITTFGRLTKQKNQKMLIEAFSNIADKHPEYSLHIYGIGPLSDDLKESINSFKLSERVFLEGLTDKPHSVLAQSDLFVLSSDYEGMPNALMEALAVGVPCISTDCPCGGPKTLINNGTNGLLVPVRDVLALTEAIDLLLTDKKYAEFLGKNAITKAKDYNPTMVFQQWLEYVESVLEE